MAEFDSEPFARVRHMLQAMIQGNPKAETIQRAGAKELYDLMHPVKKVGARLVISNVANDITKEQYAKTELAKIAPWDELKSAGIEHVIDKTSSQMAGINSLIKLKDGQEILPAEHAILLIHMLPEKEPAMSQWER